VTRYFKATDGRVTVFRAASRQVYRWVHFRTEDLTLGPAPVGEITWSIARRDGAWAAAEIDAMTYKTLTVLKARRLHADHGDTANTGSPQNSWVRNADLERVL
jgi:hypothetical protein